MGKLKTSAGQRLIQISIFAILSEKTHAKDYNCSMKCDFPFVYKDITYEACAVADIGNPWCVTNQSEYYKWARMATADDNYHLLNVFWFSNKTKRDGWEYCSEYCLVDDRCPKCESVVGYSHDIIRGCTFEYNQLHGVDKHQTEPWCAINATAFEKKPNYGMGILP